MLAQAGGQTVPGGAGVVEALQPIGALQPQIADGEEIAGPKMVRLLAEDFLEVVQRRRWLALPLPVVAQQEIVEGTARPHCRRPSTLLRGAIRSAELLQVAGAAQVVGPGWWTQLNR